MTTVTETWHHTNKRRDRNHAAVEGRKVWTQYETIFDEEHPDFVRPPTVATFCAVCNDPLALYLGKIWSIEL